MTYYHTPIYGPIVTVDDLHKAVKLNWEEGKKIQNNYKRLEEGYYNWEDRLIAIENAITALEDETGLSEEEVLAKPKDTPKQDVDFDLDGFLSE